MALAEPLTDPAPQALDTAIVDARIVDAKVVDGKIVDGRIIGGQVAEGYRLSRRTARALHIEAEHTRTELIAVIGLALALLLMYVI